MTAIFARERYETNRVAHAFVQPPLAVNTDVAPIQKKDTEFALKAPPYTPERSSNTTAYPIITAEQTVTPQLPLADNSTNKVVDGVVCEVKADSIVVQLALDNHLRLALPPSLFPQELRKFGAPVRISLDTSLGYRRPIVKPREAALQAPLPGQDEIDDWLRSN